MGLSIPGSMNDLYWLGEATVDAVENPAMVGLAQAAYERFNPQHDQSLRQAALARYEELGILPLLELDCDEIIVRSDAEVSLEERERQFDSGALAPELEQAQVVNFMNRFAGENLQLLADMSGNIEDSNGSQNPTVITSLDLQRSFDTGLILDHGSVRELTAEESRALEFLRERLGEAGMNSAASFVAELAEQTGITPEMAERELEGDRARQEILLEQYRNSLAGVVEGSTATAGDAMCSTEVSTYTVQPGDGFDVIARNEYQKQFGERPSPAVEIALSKRIAELNNNDRNYSGGFIYPGQVLMTMNGADLEDFIAGL